MRKECTYAEQYKGERNPTCGCEKCWEKRVAFLERKIEKLEDEIEGMGYEVIEAYERGFCAE